MCVSTARTCTHPNAIKNVVWFLRILENDKHVNTVNKHQYNNSSYLRLPSIFQPTKAIPCGNRSERGIKLEDEFSRPTLFLMVINFPSWKGEADPTLSPLFFPRQETISSCDTSSTSSPTSMAKPSSASTLSVGSKFTSFSYSSWDRLDF